MRVIRFVEAHAIPAGLELDLGAQTVGAVGVVHEVRFGHGVFVEAGEADAVRDGSRVRVGLGRRVVRAEGSVAGDHAEARGEGHDVGAVVTAAEVIDCHPLVGDFFEGAVGVLVVEDGRPVGGFVGLDFAGRAVGGLKGGVGGVEADVGSTGDFVGVRAELSEADDGVDAADCHLGTGHSEEGRGVRRQDAENQHG